MKSILMSLHQGFNLSEIKTWSQTSAIIFKETSEKKIDHFLK
jgi:hypothetical protein